MVKAFQMDNGKGFIFGQWENFQFNGQWETFNITVSTQIALGDQMHPQYSASLAVLQAMDQSINGSVNQWKIVEITNQWSDFDNITDEL